jgi:hypothetical protein
MQVRQIVLSAVLVVLVWTPGFALAQSQSPTGPSDWQSMRRTLFPDRGSTMQMQGLMQQMAGMMEHMAERVQAGPLIPEESKQMAELMQRITDMTNHLSWMMSGGTSVLDMSQQMATMTEQITAEADETPGGGSHDREHMVGVVQDRGRQHGRGRQGVDSQGQRPPHRH